MSLHRTTLRARVLRAGVTSVLALALVGGYAAAAVAEAADPGANRSAQAQQKSKAERPAQAQPEPKAERPAQDKQENKQHKQNKKSTRNAAAAGASSSPGKGTGSGRVETSGSATSKEEPAGRRPSSEVGSENGTGAAGSPPGNNGTVKIAPLGELDSIPNNTAHPGCTFQVEWYGFDEGEDVVSSVSFAMQAPTPDVGLSVDGPSEVFVGGSPGRGAGNGGLDGAEAYTLAFDGVPHPKQGYHVGLTVSTPHSNGNDTKTKVFWVAPCDSAGEAASAFGAAGPAGSGSLTAAPWVLTADPFGFGLVSDASAVGPVSDVSAVGGVSDAFGAGQVSEVSGVASAAAASAQSQTAGPVPANIAAGLRSVWTRPGLPLGVALGAVLLAGALVLRRRTRGHGV